jgi:hypothetical protein
MPMAPTICFSYHLQIYTLEVNKSGLRPYDDKRYLLADLADGRPNPNTHAYGHWEVASDELLEQDIPEEPGSEILVEHREQRFRRKHARVVRKLASLAQLNDQATEDEAVHEPMPDAGGDLLDGVELQQAEREAAARPGLAVRMGEALENIIAHHGLARPVSPPLRMPPVPARRAGPSGDSIVRPPHAKRARAILSSSDEELGEQPDHHHHHNEEDDAEKNELQVARRRRVAKRSRLAHAFIDAEAGADAVDDDDDDDDDEDGYDSADLADFIVDDDNFV